MMKALFSPPRGDSSDSSVTVSTHNCHLKKASKINGFRTFVTVVTIFSISLSSQKKDTKTGTLMSISIPWNMAKGIMSFPE